MERSSRRRFLASAAAACAALAGCSSSPGSGDGGTTAPDHGDGTSTTGAGDAASGGLRLETVAVEGSPGGEITFDPPGEPVLLDFFATWCAPCKPQMEHLRTIHGEFDALSMRSVTRETDADAIRSFWRDYEGTWPVAMDPKLFAFEKYGVTRVPVKIILDAEGNEVWRHAGLAGADQIRGPVEEALA